MHFLQFPCLTAVRLSSLVVVLAFCACIGDKSVEQFIAASEAALAKNEPTTSLIEAKNALQKNPESAPARRLLGLALLRTGDAAGAEAALRRALELGQPPEQIVPALAQSLLAQRQFKSLTDEFDGTTLAPAQAQAQLKTLLATAYRAMGEAEMSEVALVAALKADPNHLPALLLSARGQAAKGNINGALEAVEALLLKQPGEADIWLLKGDLQRDFAAQPDAALSAYRKAVELSPRLPGGHLEVAETLMRLGRMDEAAAPLEAAQKLAPQAARGVYLQAIRALTRRDLEAARKGSQVLLAGAPENPRFLTLAGDVAMQTGSLTLAAKHLERAAQLAPRAVQPRTLLARVQLLQHEPAQALATLKPLMENGAAPDAAIAELAGDAWRASGNLAQAGIQYAIVARLDPGNTRARTSLALTHLAAGKEEFALSELRGAAQAGPNVDPDLALIKAHITRQELPQALAAIDGLQRKLPASPLPSNLRGRALLGAKDWVGARRSFEQALTLAPDYFPAIDGLAALDMVEKKPDAARHRFEAVIAKQPKHGAALLALANLGAITGIGNDKVVALLVRAIAAEPNAIAPRLGLIDLKLRMDDATGALAAAQDAVNVLAQNSDALAALGRVQVAIGDFEVAIITLRKVVAMQPLSPVPLLRLATAQRAAKQSSAAGASLRRALVLQPDLLDAQRGLVTLAVESGDFPAALSIARSVQPQRPKEVAGYLFEGEVEAAQKHWAAAAVVYQRGLKQVPSVDLARRTHAALGAAGDTASRERFTAAWLIEHPRDAAFRLYLGDVRAAQRDFVGAEKMYDAAVQLQPANPEALNNLAWVSGRLGRQGALAYAEKAVALAPENPGHLDTLAMLLVQKKDYAQAITHQSKALALQPSNSLFRLNLARILLLANRKEDARKELQTLAGLGDKFGGQSEVSRLLKSM